MFHRGRIASKPLNARCAALRGRSAGRWVLRQGPFQLSRDILALKKLARRIRGRTIWRCGQLLEEIRPAQNQYDASAGSGTR